jgi:hypothetical protein
MLGKNNQILDIDNTIAERRGANIAQGIICAPVIHHNTHIGGIDNPIPVEINNWKDWRSPDIPAPRRPLTIRMEVN